jgi:outer membrane lipopolysaccharide assembly protein LptE/RlpB
MKFQHLQNQEKLLVKVVIFSLLLKEMGLNPLTVNLMRPFPHKFLAKEG